MIGKRRRFLRTGSAGFSLLELLTVIVIIGVLAGMISTAVMMAKKKAQSDATTSERETIKSALEAYRFEYQEWPCEEGSQEKPEGSKSYKENNYIVINDWLMKYEANKNDRNVRFLNLGDYRTNASGALIDYDGDTYNITFDFDKDTVSVD